MAHLSKTDIKNRKKQNKSIVLAFECMVQALILITGF